MSGRYIPPHKRGIVSEAAIASQAAIASSLASGTSASVASAAVDVKLADDYEFQKEMWDALKRTITGIINKVAAANIKAVAVELFRENIVRGRGLLCQCLIRTQQADPDLTPVFAALVAVVNREFPAIGFLLLRRLVCLWKKLYRRRSFDAVKNINRFLSHLYAMYVVDEDIVMELVIAHLLRPNRTDDDVDLAVQTIQETYKVMLERNPQDFYTNLLDPLREVLLTEESPLSARGQAVVEGLLKQVQDWQKSRAKVAAVSSDLQLVPKAESTTHHVELDGAYSEDATLDGFQYDAAFEAKEAQYEAARVAILGPNWQSELLEAAEAAEEEKWMAEQVETTNGGAPMDDDAAKKVADIAAQEEERRIRGAVYMAIRSSVRADEIAHKLLKSVIVPGSERSVCLMVLDTCCEEVTYKKIYCLVGERLCKTFTALQLAFADVFKTKYDAADALSQRHIDHIGAFWAHMLRTESMRWNCLSCLDILTEDVSQRLLIQALFQQLARSMGLNQLHLRLFGSDNGSRHDGGVDGGELEFALRKLFPLQSDDLSAIQLAIDLYESMGVGLLANGLRLRFESLRLAKRAAEQSIPFGKKRDRED